MRKALLIFVFICGQNLLFSQVKNLISFQTQWEKFSIDNNTDLRISENDEREIFFINFLLNNKKDTIFVSKSRFSSKIDTKNKFENRFILDASGNKANLLIWNGNETDTLSFHFIQKGNSILVNQDEYVLNKSYFSFLKKKVLKNKNITEIIDFLDDNLGNYFLSDEIFLMSSKSKYKNKFQILRAKVKTIKSDSDGLDFWKISYHYDKNGLLSMKKINEKEEFSLIKKRKYIDFEKIIFHIEENTAKRSTITQQELFFLSKKQKISQQNVQYGLNITNFVKSKSIMKLN